MDLYIHSLRISLKGLGKNTINPIFSAKDSNLKPGIGSPD
jgi:hypothetical protein